MFENDCQYQLANAMHMRNIFIEVSSWIDLWILLNETAYYYWLSKCRVMNEKRLENSSNRATIGDGLVAASWRSIA